MQRRPGQPQAQAGHGLGAAGARWCLSPPRILIGAFESWYVHRTVDPRWLVKLFEEAGLKPEDANRAAELTLGRLLRRQRPKGAGKKSSLLHYMVRDPLVSVNRIIGKGDEGLPLIDPDTGHLSTAAFTDVLAAADVDPVVSMAYAKVVVEAFEPKDLYQPVWQALGHEGEVDLEALRREDWTPLRRAAEESGALPADSQPTRQVAALKKEG